MDTTVIALLPIVAEPDPNELGPPLRAGAGDELSAYVIREVIGGRSLFGVLEDRYVTERADEYVSVIEHLAADSAVRAALVMRGWAQPPLHSAFAA